MKRPLGIALVGCSGIATYYAQKIQKLPGVALVAMHSRCQERAEAFAAEHGIASVYSDLQTLCADPGVDALVIVNEPSRHMEAALAGVQAGKHLLIEKPLAHSVAAAEPLLQAADGKELSISVISPYRFNPLLQEMKNALSQMDREAPITALLTLRWARGAEYYAKGDGWRASQGAVLMNQGIHWLDTLNWFFGPPLEVQAQSAASRPFVRCADSSHALIHYAQGVTAMVAATTHLQRSQPDRFTILHSGGELDYQSLLGPRSAGSFRTRLGRWLLGQPRWGRTLPDSMTLQLEDFISAMGEKRPPRVTLADGMRALKLAEEVSQLTASH
uniref:Gfo/Idh/MocA family oxidoreductase n=1 Tax=Magnetococcus massalia (strain MO-1) TaxID=451514 RepID=A0A1S7LPE3_MAGMO|nr:Protein of unknown function. putative oxidoreductase [Candidatus Magnetococcus massalia]